MSVVLCTALALGLLSGCGGDDEPIGDDPVSISVPDVSVATDEEQAGGSGATTTDSGDDGGGSGSNDSGGVSAPNDTAEDDKPPKPGSPEEAFEKHCEQNPEACG